jgi:hypothetical protein
MRKAGFFFGLSTGLLYQFLICAIRGTRLTTYLDAVEKRISLAIRGMEPRYFGFQGRSLDTIPTELPWLPKRPVPFAYPPTLCNYFCQPSKAANLTPEL